MIGRWSHPRALCLVVLLLVWLLPGAGPVSRPSASGFLASPPPDQAAVATALGKTPLLFQANGGQIDPTARFLARGPGAPLWLTDDGLWLQLRQPNPTDVIGGINLKLGFAGANRHPVLEPFGQLSARVTTFTGRDSAARHGDDTAWSGVRYKGLYPGVDLEISGLEGRPRWRWLGQGAAGLNERMTVAGADVVAHEGGQVRLHSAIGEIVLALPTIAGDTQADTPGADIVAASPGTSADDDLLRAAVTASDINYGTFLGGTASERGRAIAVDRQGMIYVAGDTGSTDFPTTPGAFDSSRSGVFFDAFVVKLNPNASGAASLIYASYLGGTESETAYSVAVDSQGMIIVAGNTASANFPTTSTAYDQSFNGISDIFVTKLNPNAAGAAGLVYSTYFGAAAADIPYGLALDSAGIAYLTGQTLSGGFPVTAATAFDATMNGSNDAFVVKLNPAVSGAGGLVYSTFLGGTGLLDVGYGIAVDAAGIAYVTGDTEGAGFPTLNAFQSTFGGARADAFVAKLNPAVGGAAGLLYASYLGGGTGPDVYGDSGSAIAVDSAGNAYVTGWTNASNFPTTSGRYSGDPDPTFTDVFVAKVNTLAIGAASLVYSTYLGGNNFDYAYGVAVDADGAIYVTGAASSTFPTTPTAYDRTWHGGDAFVTKINPANGGAADLLYSTFLGSGEGAAIAVDAQKAVYVTGRTFSPAFPTSPNGYDRTFTGVDAFALKLLTTSGATSWYFAEGNTGDGFDQYFTIQNPNAADSSVSITYYFTNAAPSTKTLTAKATSRTTVNVFEDALGVGRGKAVGAKVVVSNGIGIIVERPIYFAYAGVLATGQGSRAAATITGGHNAMGARQPMRVWYFAEGYTGDGFDEYLTILNPNATAADVKVTYLKADGTTKAYTRQLPAERRMTVTVHDPVEGVGRTNGAAGGVSATVETTNGVNIVAERSMYFTYNGSITGITGGHNVVGANASATTWYFAEGYTGDGFDEYLTIQNPNSVSVTATVTFYLADGSRETRSVTALPTSRVTIAVHDPIEGVGRGKAVSAKVESSGGLGIIVERPMYFRYEGNRTGGHNVMGAAAARPTWYLAEGYTGTGFDEYLTLLNPNATPADVTITYYLSDGSVQPKTITIPANSRHTTAVHGTSEGVGVGQAVSAKVESTNPGGIIVERPMYFTYKTNIDGGHIVVGYAP